MRNYLESEPETPAKNASGAAVVKKSTQDTSSDMRSENRIGDATTATVAN